MLLALMALTGNGELVCMQLCVGNSICIHTFALFDSDCQIQ